MWEMEKYLTNVSGLDSEGSRMIYSVSLDSYCYTGN